MKKEFVALALLLLIIIGNIWNQRRLNGLISDLDDLTEEAYAASQAQNWSEAEAAARSAENRWSAENRYTHVFIRHTDIDALTEAFCDYRGAIAGHDEGNILGSFLRLSAGLHSLLDMETLSAGSVF